MGEYTSNYSLYLPSVGETGWGNLVNQNFAKIDQNLPITTNDGSRWFVNNASYNKNMDTWTQLDTAKGSSAIHLRNDGYGESLTCVAGTGAIIWISTSLDMANVYSSTGTVDFLENIIKCGTADANNISTDVLYLNKICNSDQTGTIMLNAQMMKNANESNLYWYVTYSNGMQTNIIGQIINRSLTIDYTYNDTLANSNIISSTISDIYYRVNLTKGYTQLNISVTSSENSSTWLNGVTGIDLVAQYADNKTISITNMSDKIPTFNLEKITGTINLSIRLGANSNQQFTGVAHGSYWHKLDSLTYSANLKAVKANV